MTGLVAEMAVTRRDGFTLDASLVVEPGETAALLGPNGAGKSTAVMTLAGLVALERGRIELGGRALDDPAAGVFVPPEERRIGVVFQDQLLFPHLTVAENIGFGLGGRRGRERFVAEWLERVGLAGMGDRRPGELSGGEAQRVALARALSTSPEMLLLDEPLSALDVGTRVRMRRELTEHLADFAGPRLLITHDPTEAFLLADRILILEEGAITQVGSADEVRLHPRTRYAADLAGSNVLTGQALDGIVDVDGHPLHIADHEVRGPVVAAIRPSSVVVHLARPEGSSRNVWPTEIEAVESLGDRTRLRTGAPIPLIVEVTGEAVDGLGLRAGAAVWVSIKATEIAVQAG